jgi:hypothetical protein
MWITSLGCLNGDLRRWLVLSRWKLVDDARHLAFDEFVDGDADRVAGVGVDLLGVH